MIKIGIISCKSCDATGEGYSPGLYGDGWTGGRCVICNGWGAVLIIGKRNYEFAGPYGRVYRNDKGQFAHIPKEVYG